MQKIKALLPILSFSFFSVFAFAAPADNQPNAQMQAVLDQLVALKPKPIETLSPAEARIQPTPADAVRALLAKRGQVPDDMGINDVREIKVKGGAGEIPARLYKPEANGKSLPLIVYYHGGGFVIADPETYDGSARALAKKAKAIVLSVEYRKAPEAKFPAAHDDAFAAYVWAIDNAADLGVDKNRVALAGESAGANLALNVAVKARDEKAVMPVAILTIYPVAGNDLSSPSYDEYANAKPLNKSMMLWFFSKYLEDQTQNQDSRLNLLSANLNGLPPTIVVTAQIDPLRTEGEQLARKLKQAGNNVWYQNYLGVTHEFFGMGDAVDQAKVAQNAAAAKLRRYLR